MDWTDIMCLVFLALFAVWFLWVVFLFGRGYQIHLDLKELNTTLAQLRHLYSHLANGRDVDAKSLLAPEIWRLEKIQRKFQ